MDEHVVGEGARIMSGHVASRPTNKHKGVGWGGGCGLADKHNEIRDFGF